MNYQEAIRIAEERERHLKKAFEEYDDDNSGTIDSDEILVLMEAIGLLKNLKSNRIEFITEMFMKYDENNDGVLSFEEFKGVHNAASSTAALCTPLNSSNESTPSLFSSYFMNISVMNSMRFDLSLIHI